MNSEESYWLVFFLVAAKILVNSSASFNKCSRRVERINFSSMINSIQK